MAHKIEKILFTTDLSKSSVKVFEQTVVLAASLGAAITILHVIDDGSGSSGSQSRMVHLVDRDVYEKIRRESQDMVKNLLIGKQRTIPVIQDALKRLCEKTTDKLGEDHEVTIDAIEVTYGNVADAIIELSEATQCDLVVMGYNKKGSLFKALLGSPEKSVMKQSKKPILLIPLET
ncbi:universal stress protein [Desulfatitalea alkaliphila]|uniref:Universal stress protein n=1 Tax=Desulfatitalea alkaliphila TaxID=2929485 RepID=A0AA41UH41_9BACT|nr:universal stress protein [Desulfatitalea alkaliphila]MCJ8499215.1 universal stress protein [Desulfatitalea alkaliphila]